MIQDSLKPQFAEKRRLLCSQVECRYDTVCSYYTVAIFTVHSHFPDVTEKIFDNSNTKALIPYSDFSNVWKID